MEVLNVGSVNFKDLILQCCDCKGAFTHTIGEQRYFASKGLSTPKRCQECRQIRKQTLVTGVCNDSH
jgi:hypothetical protein